MTYKPPFLVVDYETEEDGRGSTEFYKPTFRVTSAAFSWLSEDSQVKSKFIQGEDNAGAFLFKAVKQGIPLVAHNVQFELGVTRCRYPSIASEATWLADTMRLVQVFDNGGDKFAFETIPTLDDQLDRLIADAEDKKDGAKKAKPEKPKTTAGLGLVKACKRVLKITESHKEEAHQWLRENVEGCKAGKEGSYLNALPADILERYNIGDSENTLKLFVHLRDFFAQIGYDWSLDHSLYMNSVNLLVQAKIDGVPVDRSKLQDYRNAVDSEITGIAQDFIQTFSREVAAVERERLLNRIRKLKRLRGRKKFIARYRMGSLSAVKDVRFNVGSNKQLASLFVDTLRIQPQFLTDKGQPSFRSAVLSQWGNGGELLKKRRKRLLVLKQCDSLLDLTAYDSRWHLDLKACGTSTGRFAGGSY